MAAFFWLFLPGNYTMDSAQIFKITNQKEFLDRALELFNYQYNFVPVYREFCEHLKVTPSSVQELTDIPFIPISLFKSHKILASNQAVAQHFTSSGTTGDTVSTHFVSNLELYEQSFNTGFKHFYGPPEDWVVLGLLPSYMERSGSSLVYMVDSLIKSSKHKESGFYLHNLQALRTQINKLEEAGKKYLLIGVSFALLDLAELGKLPIKRGIIMETGGMKGRRKELIRAELHAQLQGAFGQVNIHSEYGMTELLSQAYSKGKGVFKCPPWMHLLIRQTNDPFNYVKGQTGGVSVIDLANINSCAFIATQDLGKDLGKGNYEILGRFDNSDVRGCNLMVL